MESPRPYYTNNTFDITEDIIEGYDDDTKTGTVTVKAIYQDLTEGSHAPTTITYDPNGGTGNRVTVDTGAHGNLLVNEPVVALSVNDAKLGYTRTGYEFTGWNTDPNGEGLSVAAGDDIAADLRNLDKNTQINTLYAQWKQIKYTVVYTDGVEGETIFDDQSTPDLVEGAATPAFEGDDPEREGYAFDGWNPAVKDTVSGEDADEKSDN